MDEITAPGTINYFEKRVESRERGAERRIGSKRARGRERRYSSSNS